MPVCFQASVPKKKEGVFISKPCMFMKEVVFSFLFEIRGNQKTSVSGKPKVSVLLFALGPRGGIFAVFSEHSRFSRKGGIFFDQQLMFARVLICQN